MEEISWGQRVLGIGAPDIMDRVNVQGEISLHNIEMFYFSRGSICEAMGDYRRAIVEYNFAQKLNDSAEFGNIVSSRIEDCQDKLKYKSQTSF